MTWHIISNDPASETDKLFVERAIKGHDDLLAALKAIRGWMIPGMNWTDQIGIALKEQADAAIAKAERPHAMTLFSLRDDRSLASRRDDAENRAINDAWLQGQPKITAEEVEFLRHQMNKMQRVGISSFEHMADALVKGVREGQVDLNSRDMPLIFLSTVMADRALDFGETHLAVDRAREILRDAVE